MNQALSTTQQGQVLGATIPETYGDLKEQALMLLKSGMLPTKFAGKPEAVVITMLYGKELGLTPMQAVKEINVINNTPSISANLMLTLVRQRIPKAEIRVMVATAKLNKIQFRRNPADEWQIAEYTIEEAVAAGLTGKDNWKKHPTDMLFARNASRICRWNFSDVFNGSIYTPEELEETLVKQVEAAVVAEDAKAPQGDTINEEAVMDLVAGLLECQDAQAADKLHNDFCNKYSESPATVAAAWDAYNHQLNRLK